MKLLCIILLLTSCGQGNLEDGVWTKVLYTSKQGRVCFTVFTPEEIAGRYCVDKVK